MKRFQKVTIGVVVVAVTAMSFLTYLSYERNKAYEAGRQATEVTYPAATKSELLEKVNAERTKAGLSPFNVDERIAAVAQIKADDMIAKGYLQHEIPGTGNVATPYMLEVLNQTCVKSGENLQASIGRDQRHGDNAIEWWMNSKPHREAILSNEYNLAGFGVGTRSDGTHVYVQYFCVSK